jgi:hypothetical protein
MYLSELDAEWLAEDPNWVVSAIVTDIYNEKQNTLEDGVDFDAVQEIIRVTAQYTDIMSTIGPRNPGVLDLYATRPSLTNPEIPEVVNLMTSNVILQLGDRTSPIITI